MLSELSSDCRYAVRALLRSPGFAVAAIVTIALGVGVNAGVFTILNGVLFRDVPAPDAHELVQLEQTVEGAEFTATTGGNNTFTIADYRTYRDRSQTLSGLLAYSGPRETTLGGDAPQKVYGALVSCNYFAVLQALPQVGRALGAQDCEPGAEPVVLLGHALWTSTFASDPRIVGRTVELAGNRFTVVGVAAEGTYGGSPVQTGYFAPLSAEPLLWTGDSRYEDERARWLSLLGRRAAGVGVDAVRAELAVISAQIDQLEPGRTTTLAVARASSATLPTQLRGPATGAAAVLLGAFGLILLIACANVANLLLARGMARSREIGVRLSLGASRGRIVRQLMTESLLLSIVGGVLGSLLALWSFQALVALAMPTAIHPEVPIPALELDFSPDFRVLSYALGITMATGVLFGLAPALQASKPDLNTVIKQDVAAGGRRGGRLRGTLVGVQIALCMALMMATGLLLRGLQSTYTIDPGFRLDNVAHLSFGTDGGPAFLDRRFLDEVAALPGVEAAAYVSQTPLGEAVMGSRIRLPGDAENQQRFAEMDAVTPGFFAMLDLPIVRGRNFTAAESADAAREASTRPVIVTVTTARNLWGEADPLGRTLLLDDTTLEVVGVAADARLGGLGAVDPFYVYLPRFEGRGGELLFRSRGDSAATAASVLALVRARDANAVARVLPLGANLAWFRGLSGIVTTLGAALGVLALALATVGVYGIVSYAVTSRYRELGIRLALGARPRDLLGMILRRAMRPVAIGAVVGVAVTAALTRVLASVLFGVSPADPLGIGGAALLVIGVALGAGALAALPAMRAEPTTTLRYE